MSDDKSKFLELFKDPSTQSHAAELVSVLRGLRKEGRSQLELTQNVVLLSRQFAGLGSLAPEEALSFSVSCLMCLKIDS